MTRHDGVHATPLTQTGLALRDEHSFRIAAPGHAGARRAGRDRHGRTAVRLQLAVQRRRDCRRRYRGRRDRLKVTNNAAVATGIGLGAVAGARAGVQYSQRVAHRYTQEQIAKAAGPLDVGGVAPWSTHHSFPIEDDEQGRVTVSRMISIGPLDCKEIVFAVDTPAKPDKAAQSSFYVATICRDGPVWKWASAEPATERWGALQ